MGDEEEVTPKGHDVHVELEVTLKDLYLGHQFKVGTFHTFHRMTTGNRGPVLHARPLWCVPPQWHMLWKETIKSIPVLWLS